MSHDNENDEEGTSAEKVTAARGATAEPGLDALLAEFRADVTPDERARMLRADDELYDELGLPR